MISSKVKHFKKGVPRLKDEAKKVKKKSKQEVTVVSDHVHQKAFESEKMPEKILSFPLLETIERDRMLPRYSAVLKRAPEEGVLMDDLDALQLELEALLSAVVVRSRVLRREIHTLSSAEEKQKKGNSSNKIGNTSKLGAANKPIKKFKEKSRDGNTQLSIKFTKVKSIPSTNSSSINACLPEYEPDVSTNTVSQRFLQPRYDVPNKFWATVDPYCTDITHDDVRFLENLIKEYENDLEYHKIPPIGHHYSLRWAQEELMTEQEEAHSEARNARKVTGSPMEVQTMLKKGEKACDVSTTSGSLTQRLVSALMEENIKINGNEKGDTKLSFSGENVMPRSGFFRNFAAGSSAGFEKRVRKGMEDQGILEADSQNKECDDEILLEIQRCQDELKMINSYNKNQLKRLIHLAKIQIKRQELKRKLRDIDNEVMENYRNVVSAKQKKRPLSKAEEEQCWKSLKERDVIVKKLDILGCNSRD